MVNLLPDLTPKQQAQLRASIERSGVVSPIVVDQNGQMIDGFNRERIARELGVDCPRSVRHVADDDERIALTLDLNVARRDQLTKKQRDALAEMLRQKYHWSNRRIAEALGVSHQTVDRAPGGPNGPPGGKRVGKDDRTYRHRARPHEVEKRRDAVAKLHGEGYTRDAICEALGIAHGTLHSDLIARGINPGLPREITRGPAKTIVWRDQPASQSRRPKTVVPPPPKIADDVPPYHRSWTLGTIESLYRDLHRRSSENQLANEAADAAEVRDDAWFSRARATLGAAIAQLEGLQRILDDPAERERQRERTNEFADEAKPKLRAVEA